jgi:hypothetical protein
MITQRKLNIFKVNAEMRLMKIKLYRMQQESGDNPPPVMTPPPDTASRNAQTPEPQGQEIPNA